MHRIALFATAMAVVILAGCSHEKSASTSVADTNVSGARKEAEDAQAGNSRSRTFTPSAETASSQAATTGTAETSASQQQLDARKIIENGLPVAMGTPFQVLGGKEEMPQFEGKALLQSGEELRIYLRTSAGALVGAETKLRVSIQGSTANVDASPAPDGNGFIVRLPAVVSPPAAFDVTISPPNEQPMRTSVSVEQITPM